MIFTALRSLEIAAAATVLAAVAGTAAGRGLSRSRSCLRAPAEALFMLPMVFPPTLTGYYLLVLFGKHGLIGGPVRDLTGFTLTFTSAGAVLAAAVVSFPLMVISARAAFDDVDPEYERAAATLGRSPWYAFAMVSLPLAWRGLAAGAVLSFARALGEFGATLMVAGNVETMPIAIYRGWLTGGIGAATPLVLVHTALAVAVLGLSMALRGRRDRKMAGN